MYIDERRIDDVFFIGPSRDPATLAVDPEYIGQIRINARFELAIQEGYLIFAWNLYQAVDIISVFGTGE
jgi:hypothetical protein